MKNLVLFLVFSAISFTAMCAFLPRKPQAVSIGSLTKIYTTSIQDKPSYLSIRVLILRHAPEQMAVDDGRLVEEAVDQARAKGLDIQIVGNYLVRSLEDLRSQVTANVNKNATPGDTLIVHTIGHGSAGGYLQALGQRDGVMAALVDSASANKQEMIWWQLSCYAASGLPSVDSLSAEQKDMFSNLTSSNARQVSPAGVQGRIMGKVFVALAEGNPAIDPDQDGIITANELKNYLNSLDSSRRGDLLFANNSSEPIFGFFGPWMLPIIDRSGPQHEYDRNFIPLPKFRVLWDELIR